MNQLMQGKTVLITGATAGIGEATARLLAEMGAYVVLSGRSKEKCQQTAKAITQATGNTAIDYLIADLSSMEQVRSLASQYKERYGQLDVLINNAGGVFTSRQVTVDGLELTFALNHLSYFLLTNKLLDILKESAQARIINVSSDAHKGAEIDFKNIQLERGYTAFKAYGRSKLMNIMFTYELAKRLDGTGVTANALHPGFVASNFGKNNGGLWRLAMPIAQRFAISPEQGAATSVYLASSPEVSETSGLYFAKSKAIRSSDQSYDENTYRKLWAVSEKHTGLLRPSTHIEG